jgi:hypothetical protein
MKTETEPAHDPLPEKRCVPVQLTNPVATHHQVLPNSAYVHRQEPDSLHLGCRRELALRLSNRREAGAESYREGKVRFDLFSTFNDYVTSSSPSCPFRKFHPAWDSHREVESSHDWGRCSQSCNHSERSLSICSSRGAGLKPRTCFFVINSASP